MSRPRDRRSPRLKALTRPQTAEEKAAAARHSPHYGFVWTSRGLADWEVTVTATLGVQKVGLGRTLDQDEDWNAWPQVLRALDRGWAVGGKTDLCLRATAFSAYEMPADDAVDPISALWLAQVRGPCERAAGLLTGNAWCNCCGRGFVDKRHGKRHAQQIALWCPEHQNRFRPELRECPAPGCFCHFWARSSKQVYCSASCARAGQRALRSRAMRP